MRFEILLIKVAPIIVLKITNVLYPVERDLLDWLNLNY